jgi:hypothetical protein
MGFGLFEVVFGLITGGIGCLIGIKNYERNNKNDDDEKVRHDTRIDVKLDNIAKNVDEIRLDNKDFSKTISTINERLGIAENDIQTVKGRVDDLEKLHTK